MDKRSSLSGERGSIARWVDRAVIRLRGSARSRHLLRARAGTWIRSWAAFVILLVILGQTPLYAEPTGVVSGLVVKTSQICRTVASDRTPVEGIGSDEVISKGPVHLWTVLSGDRETLKELRAKGLLPIRHQWIHANVLSLDEVGADSQHADSEPIKVGTIHHLKKLDIEVASRGAFDWRTWSCKRALRPGVYIVNVVFRTGEPVLNVNGQPSVHRFRYNP